MTPMQEKFALEVASGKSQSAAYRIAYPKSLQWKDSSVWEQASRLLADPEVFARVEVLRKEAAKQCVLSRQEWLQRLKEVSEVGEDQPSRLKALVEFGKAEGYFAPEKHEVALTSFSAVLAGIRKQRDEPDGD